MECRKLGDSDLQVSVVTFGAWAAGGWMWGGTESKDAIDAIEAAYELGVTSIDTAPVYGQGASEEIVGKALKNLPRDKVQILTKYGMRWDLAKGDFGFRSKNSDGDDIDIYKYAAKESIIAECENSLKRLGTDYIDLYQIHWPDTTTPISETMEAVSRLMEQGKVRHAGVCNYNTAQVKDAQNSINLVSNQVPYSMILRDIEEELVPYCMDNNISILAYSPLQRGLLTGKMKPGHKFSKGDHRESLSYFQDESIERTNRFLDSIRPLAKEKNATLSQLVIRWTIGQPGITIALVGARNKDQSIENAKAADVQLSAEDSKFINEQLDRIILQKA